MCFCWGLHVGLIGISACGLLGYLHVELFAYMHVGLLGYLHVGLGIPARYLFLISARVFFSIFAGGVSFWISACGACCKSACGASFWISACGAFWMSGGVWLLGYLHVEPFGYLREGLF